MGIGWLLKPAASKLEFEQGEGLAQVVGQDCALAGSCESREILSLQTLSACLLYLCSLMFFDTLIGMHCCY